PCVHGECDVTARHHLMLLEGQGGLHGEKRSQRFPYSRVSFRQLTRLCHQHGTRFVQGDDSLNISVVECSIERLDHFFRTSGCHVLPSCTWAVTPKNRRALEESPSPIFPHMI